MREIFCTLVLLGTYLYLDRFLFGGGLGGLFLEGWRERFRLPSRRKEVPATQVPSPAPGADDLVETKVYVSGQRVPEGDKREETESKTDGGNTFALPEGKTTADETTEWRDESFGRKITERYAMGRPGVFRAFHPAGRRKRRGGHPAGGRPGAGQAGSSGFPAGRTG